MKRNTRNRAKKAYYTIGVDLGSTLHQYLLQDSKESQLTVPKLIPVRLADFYKGSVALSPMAKLETMSEENTAESNAAASLDVWSEDD